MRTLLLILPLFLASAAEAGSGVPIVPPMGLEPFYGPDGPRALPADHPLYGRIEIGPVLEMPSKVGKFLVPITKASEVNAALVETLTRANMLAPSGNGAFRLTVTWRSLDAPQRISIASRAKVVIGYELRRIDTGLTLFSREITTETESRGGVGSERLKGNARLAIQANLASAIACLDKAAFGQAPENCALRQRVTYRAPQPVVQY